MSGNRVIRRMEVFRDYKKRPKCFHFVRSLRLFSLLRQRDRTAEALNAVGQ